MMVKHRIDEPGFEPRTTTHLEIHNVYGMENSRATYDGLAHPRPINGPSVLTHAPVMLEVSDMPRHGQATTAAPQITFGLRRQCS